MDDVELTKLLARDDMYIELANLMSLDEEVKEDGSAVFYIYSKSVEASNLLGSVLNDYSKLFSISRVDTVDGTLLDEFVIMIEIDDMSGNVLVESGEGEAKEDDEEEEVTEEVKEDDEEESDDEEEEESKEDDEEEEVTEEVKEDDEEESDDEEEVTEEVKEDDEEESDDEEDLVPVCGTRCKCVNCLDGKHVCYKDCGCVNCIAIP
jgi:flagellar biosynthesis GTPase FlhF